MTASETPEAKLSDLPRSDGSATYSYGGYTVIASSNGPIEAQRRDEDPYACLVDVVVRPAAGVGGTRERHLESIVQASLSQLILVKNFPRCLIQIVLQFKTSPENDYINKRLVQASTNLSAVPALLQGAVLALLSASIPLRTTATSAVVAVLGDSSDGGIVANPSPQQVESAKSVHSFAFTLHDELLLAESEGDFSMQDWERAHDVAAKICCETQDASRVGMVLDDESRPGPDMRHFLRTTMDAKVASDLHWKA